MTEEECLNSIIIPSQRRPNAYMKGIIQIHITRSCDKSCFNCTQGSNLAGKRNFITLENFEKAVLSLKDYFGVVGLFGGNPALHPQFPQLCEILTTHIPFERRGLWCNNPFGHATVMRKTFDPSHSNLNVHLDAAAYKAFKSGWPECNPVGLATDSRHSPCYVAMQDVIEDKEKIYSLIAGCDINKNWSAMIAQFRGELRGYFCEIAGAQAILHQDEEDYPDLGIRINTQKELLPWWKMPVSVFAKQVNFHCFACGVPLRGQGELACGFGKEQVSETHKQVYVLKKPKRELELIHSLDQLNSSDKKVTEYLGR